MIEARPAGWNKKKCELCCVFRCVWGSFHVAVRLRYIPSCLIDSLSWFGWMTHSFDIFRPIHAFRYQLWLQRSGGKKPTWPPSKRQAIHHRCNDGKKKHFMNLNVMVLIIHKSTSYILVLCQNHTNWLGNGRKTKDRGILPLYEVLVVDFWFNIASAFCTRLAGPGGTCRSLCLRPVMDGRTFDTKCWKPTMNNPWKKYWISWLTEALPKDNN